MDKILLTTRFLSPSFPPLVPSQIYQQKDSKEKCLLFEFWGKNNNNAAHCRENAQEQLVQSNVA